LLNDSKTDAFFLLDETCKILLDKTAENSHLYFFCSWSVFSDFKSIISKYFTIKTPIVWDKQNKGSGDLENDWGNQTELIIYCTKGKKNINYRKGNVISIPKVHSSKLIHPTQKPTELVKWLLKYYTKEGDIVLDPTMGSGTTGVACKEMNREFIGIEKDDDIFKVAESRLK